MDIDEIKLHWQSMKPSPPPGGTDADDILARVTRSKVSTLRDRLGRIYRCITIVAWISMWLPVPFLRHHPEIAIPMMAFFALMGSLQLGMLIRIRRLRFSDMTLKEAIARVTMIEEWRVRNRAIGMGLAIPLLTFMCIRFSDYYGPYMLTGCILGAVLGLITGLQINRRAVQLIRSMKQELQE